MAELDNQNKIDKSLKLIAKSSLFIFVIVIFSKILTYLYRIIIARFFGPEVYGLFSLAIIIFLWVLALSSFGLFQGVIRFVAFYRGKKEIEKIKHVIRFTLLTLFISGLFSGALLFIFSEQISIIFFNNPSLTIFLKILSIAMPIYLLAYCFLSIMQAFERIRAQSLISDLLKNFINVLALVFLIFFGLNATGLILSYSFGILAIFLASFFYCKYKLSKIFIKTKLSKDEKFRINKNLLSYSWPLIFSVALYQIISDIDSFTIGFFKTATEVGLYNAVVPIVFLMGFFPNLFVRLFFPLIIKEFSRDNISLIKEISKQVQKWIFIINLPLFLLMILFPEAIINILFGAEYILAKNALRILAIGGFIYFMSIVFSNLLLMAGKSKSILAAFITAAFVNVTLNILFVPMPLILGMDNSLGIIGAAVATTISYTLLTLIFFFQVRKNLSIIPLRRKMLGVFISVVVSGIFLIYLKSVMSYNIPNMISQTLLFLLTYVFLLFITKSLDKNDLMIFNTIKKRFKR